MSISSISLQTRVLWSHLKHIFMALYLLAITAKDDLQSVSMIASLYSSVRMAHAQASLINSHQFHKGEGGWRRSSHNENDVTSEAGLDKGSDKQTSKTVRNLHSITMTATCHKFRTDDNDNTSEKFSLRIQLRYWIWGGCGERCTGSIPSVTERILGWSYSNRQDATDSFIFNTLQPWLFNNHLLRTFRWLTNSFQYSNIFIDVPDSNYLQFSSFWAQTTEIQVLHSPQSTA